MAKYRIETEKGSVYEIDTEDAPQPEKPGAVAHGAREFWNEVNPIEGVKALGNALMDPIGTVKNMGHAQDAARVKAQDAYNRGDYGSMVRHGIEYAVPILGPQLSARGDQAASGDVPGAVGGTLGIAANYASGKVSPKPLKAAAKPVAAKLAESAAGNYESVLLPGSKGKVASAEKTAAGLAREKPVALTRGQLQRQFEAKKAAVGPKAGTAYDSKPPVTGSEVTPILDDLEKFRQKHAVAKGSNVVVNEKLNAATNDFKDKLLSLQDGAGNIPAATLDDFRDKLFRGLVNAKGDIQQTAPVSAKALEKSLAGSIRRVLDSKHPDAKAVNDTYSLYARGAEFLEDARLREKAAKSGIVTGTSTGAGAMIQRMLPKQAREILPRIAGVFDSVAWNTISGAVKQSVSEAMAKGDWKTVEKLLRGPAMAQAVKPPKEKDNE
jgi:hypothetical protein